MHREKFTSRNPYSWVIIVCYSAYSNSCVEFLVILATIYVIFPLVAKLEVIWHIQFEWCFFLLSVVREASLYKTNVLILYIFDLMRLIDMIKMKDCKVLISKR